MRKDTKENFKTLKAMNKELSVFDIEKVMTVKTFLKYADEMNVEAITRKEKIDLKEMVKYYNDNGDLTYYEMEIINNELYEVFPTVYRFK